MLKAAGNRDQLQLRKPEGTGRLRRMEVSRNPKARTQPGLGKEPQSPRSSEVHTPFPLSLRLSFDPA